MDREEETDARGFRARPELEDPAYLGRPFPGTRVGRVRRSGSPAMLLLLAMAAGTTMLFALTGGSIGLAAVCGLVAILAGWAAFVLIRRDMRRERESAVDGSRFYR